MRKAAVIGICLLVGYLGYSHFPLTRHQLDEGGYSLQEVESRPIPKQYLFNLLHNLALKSCDNLPEGYYLSGEQCEKIIDERQARCVTRYAYDVPAEIDSPLLLKVIGDRYINCVKPGLICNGQEVKNAEQAAAMCSQI